MIQFPMNSSQFWGTFDEGLSSSTSTTLNIGLGYPMRILRIFPHQQTPPLYTIIIEKLTGPRKSLIKQTSLYHNCKLLSLPRRGFSGLSVPLGKGEHTDPFSVVRLRHTTSKGQVRLGQVRFDQVRLDQVTLGQIKFRSNHDLRFSL